MIAQCTASAKIRTAAAVLMCVAQQQCLWPSAAKQLDFLAWFQIIGRIAFIPALDVADLDIEATGNAGQGIAFADHICGLLGLAFFGGSIVGALIAFVLG